MPLRHSAISERVRIVAFALAIAFVITAFAPTYIVAQATAITDLPTISSGTIDTLNVGDETSFGNYQWTVLDKNGTGVLLLSKYIVDIQPYNAKGVNTTWAESSIRRWLNSDFYNQFDDNEKHLIAESNIINADNPWYKTNAGDDTTDKVFLLSLEEVVKYFGDSGQLSNWNGDKKKSSYSDIYNENRIAILDIATAQIGEIAKRWANYGYTKSETNKEISGVNGKASEWWLRSPGSIGWTAAFINRYGYVDVSGLRVESDTITNGGIGVRPAMWLTTTKANGSTASTGENASIEEANVVLSALNSRSDLNEWLISDQSMIEHAMIHWCGGETVHESVIEDYLKRYFGVESVKHGSFTMSNSAFIYTDGYYTVAASGWIGYDWANITKYTENGDGSITAQVTLYSAPIEEYDDNGRYLGDPVPNFYSWFYEDSSKWQVPCEQYKSGFAEVVLKPYEFDGTQTWQVVSINGIPSPRTLPAGVSAEVKLLDSDKDGLPDDWEINGFDYDGVHLPLNEWGADPNKKDVFVEIDYMSGYKPSQAALNMVAKAFDERGINLHIDFGTDSVDYVTDRAWGDYSGGTEISYEKVFNANKDNWLAVANASMPSAARQRVFHHCLYVNQFSYDGIANSSGLGGIGGQIMIVALGIVNKIDKTMDKTKAEAGTFMHELGHNLGLQHGGDQGNNDYNEDIKYRYKPNYLSVMNYSFQFTGLYPSGKLDFSNYKLPDLNENKLSEYDGVDPQMLTAGSGLGTIYYSNEVIGVMAHKVEAVAGKRINWNGNKLWVGWTDVRDNIENSVKCDINTGGNGVSTGIVDKLAGFDDWYYLINTNWGEFDNLIGKQGEGLTVADMDALDYPAEITLEEIEEILTAIEDAPISSNDDERPYPIWFWVAGGIVVIGVGITVLVLLRRKRAQK